MKQFYGFSLALLLMTVGTAHAKSDTIYFGGQNGSPSFGYLPSSLTVNVGDTVVWVGPFSNHTLKSGSPAGGIPAGAPAFSKTDFSGNSFSYPVTASGIYNFECTLHAAGEHMYSTFTAASAGVNTTPSVHVILEPVYPNPVVNEAMVDFMLDRPAHVSLRVFNALGDLVQTSANENMDAGMHMLMLNTKTMPSGTYFYALQAGQSLLEQNMIVVK